MPFNYLNQTNNQIKFRIQKWNVMKTLLSVYKRVCDWLQLPMCKSNMQDTEIIMCNVPGYPLILVEYYMPWEFSTTVYHKPKSQVALLHSLFILCSTKQNGRVRLLKLQIGNVTFRVDYASTISNELFPETYVKISLTV